VVAILYSALLGGLAAVVPPYDLSATTRLTLVVPLFFFGIQVFTAWFYLSSLRNFKQGFRVAFVYLCGGTVMFTLFYTWLAAISYFGLERYAALKYLAAPVAPSAVGFVLMYLGFRQYARLVGVKSRLTSLRFTIGVFVLIAVVHVLLPHRVPVPVGEEIFYDLTLVVSWVITLFAMWGSVLVRQIIKTANSAYLRPLRFLRWYLALISLIVFINLISLWFTVVFMGPQYSLLVACSGIIPELLLLFTGYDFKKSTGR
jgi:hypothetical protein